MTFAGVQAAYERWLTARAALTAGRRRDLPAPPEIAAAAEAAYDEFWKAAGAFEREQRQPGFRMSFAGYWLEGAEAGAIVDAEPPAGPLSTPSWIKRREAGPKKRGRKPRWRV